MHFLLTEQAVFHCQSEHSGSGLGCYTADTVKICDWRHTAAILEIFILPISARPFHTATATKDHHHLCIFIHF